MASYRVALSSDFIKPDGSPAYPMFDLSPLDQKNVEFSYLECEHEIDAVEIADFDALILLAHQFTKNSVPENGRLASVARFGVGYDTVDVTACTNNGIAVVITPDGVRRPVAASVLAFMLALSGKLLIKDKLTRQGPQGWMQRGDHMGVGLTGKTLGILGFGNIGAEIVKLARPLDMSFIAFDPYADASALKANGVESVTLTDLFKRSDILSVNCLLNEETHHIVDAEHLALMKPTAYLINTSRGPIIDEQALISALKSGTLAGAGLDVFETEPAAPDNELFTMDNVIVSPHALCWTDECFAGNGAADVKAVLDIMQGVQPNGIVNREILNDQIWLAKLNGFKTRFG